MTKRKQRKLVESAEEVVAAMNGDMRFDASSWKPDVIELQLSKGAVKMTVPDVAGLVVSSKSGQVPNGLRELLVNQMKGGSGKRDKDWEPGPEDLEGIVAFMEIVVRAAVFEPIIVPDGSVPDYEQGQIAYSNFSIEDKMQIFQKAVPDEMGGAANFSG